MLTRSLSKLYQVPQVKRFLWHAWYDLLARRYRERRWTFMNYGYRPPEGTAALVLAPEDEQDRSWIQLYYEVAGAMDLIGREVLEVGSGRGGGASFVARYLRPRRLVGVDLAGKAVEFSRARHPVPGLSFEWGDAEHLGFAPASFDVVLNVESSHCYGELSAFVGEVRRVLRPGGYFLYADFRPLAELEAWRSKLMAAGLQFVEERDITAGVVEALDADHEQKKHLIAEHIDRALVRVFGHFVGLRGTILYDGLHGGTVVYRAFVFQKGAAARSEF